MKKWIVIFLLIISILMFSSLNVRYDILQHDDTIDLVGLTMGIDFFDDSFELSVPILVLNEYGTLDFNWDCSFKNWNLNFMINEKIWFVPLKTEIEVNFGDIINSLKMNSDEFRFIFRQGIVFIDLVGLQFSVGVTMDLIYSVPQNQIILDLGNYIFYYKLEIL